MTVVAAVFDSATSYEVAISSLASLTELPHSIARECFKCGMLYVVLNAFSLRAVLIDKSLAYTL
jgi:hypothetical protein